MQRCEQAVELLRELQRDTWIPPYNAAAIRQISSETTEMMQALTSSLERKKKYAGFQTLGACACS